MKKKKRQSEEPQTATQIFYGCHQRLFSGKFIFIRKLKPTKGNSNL